MCIHTVIDTFRDSRSDNTLKAALAFLMPFSIKRNLGFLKKWLSPGLGQETYITKLTPFVLEIKETLKTDEGDIRRAHE